MIKLIKFLLVVAVMVLVSMFAGYYLGFLGLLIGGVFCFIIVHLVISGKI